MKVYRHSLIFGLSYALDIAGKNNLSHSKSTAYVSVMIGRELGLDKNTERNLYYAALLHDIGVSNEYVIFEHCRLGAEMLKKLPLPAEIPEYVLYHHEFYDGSGAYHLAGDEIPLISHIICFASAFDDTFGKKASKFDRDLFIEIQNWLQINRVYFSEKILTVFESLISREYFLLDYFSYETKYLLSNKIIIDDGVYYGYDDVLKYAVCFAEIIDRRSPFTYTHSRGIAELARKAAAFLGYGSDIQDKMYLAGLLHDLGKLHVSTDILHKNGKLTPEERFEINKHTYYTRKILEQIQGLEDIVDYAANHHEKLDGTGYPYHIAGEQLSELERVMAICDVYQALVEERPYRKKLPLDKVWSIINGMAENNHLDKKLAEKLKTAFS